MFFEDFTDMKKLLIELFAPNEVLVNEANDRYHVHFLHDSKMKNFLNLPVEKKLVSILMIGKFGGFRRSLLTRREDTVLSVSILLGIEKHENSLVEVMPSQVRMFRCPQGIYIEKAFYFDQDRHAIVDKKGRDIDLKSYVAKLLRQHLRPTRPLLGGLSRLSRYFRWVVFAPLLSAISHILAVLIFATSGNKVSLERSDGKSWVAGFRNDFEDIVVTPNVTISEEKKVSFFGLDIAPIPLFLYSLAHLAFYATYQILEWNLPILRPLVENNFFNILYVIVSYYLYENVLTRAFSWLVKKTWNKHLNLAEPLERKISVLRR